MRIESFTFCTETLSTLSPFPLSVIPTFPSSTRPAGQERKIKNCTVASRRNPKKLFPPIVPSWPAGGIRTADVEDRKGRCEGCVVRSRFAHGFCTILPLGTRLQTSSCMHAPCEAFKAPGGGRRRYIRSTRIPFPKSTQLNSEVSAPLGSAPTQGAKRSDALRSAKIA